MSFMNRRAALLLGALTLAGAAAPASAQGAYPNRPIRLIVPQSAGGAADVLARTVADKLSQAWGIGVVVDNRSGAAGIIGTQAVAQAAPDGYTLLMGAISTHGINRSLYQDLPYDPVKDFAPVTLVASAPLLVVVNPAVPAKSVKELVALAKAKPHTLNFSSAGSGNSTHLAGELFKIMADVDIVHVPYKGSTPAETGLMAGEAQLMFSSIVTAMPQAKAGRMRALAVTSAKRSSIMPELPTVAEAGLPGYDVNPWYGLFAPAGTPPEIVDKIQREVAKVLQLPDVKQRFASLGADAASDTPAEFASFVSAEIDKWAKVVKQSGAKPD